MSRRQPGDASADNDSLSMRGNFLALLIGRLFAALSLWLALIVIAKLSDPATVGIYAFAQAICLPITEIARMGLRQAQASDTRGEYEFGDYLGLRVLATAVAFALMLAAGVNASASQTVLLVVVLYALTRCVELLSDMIYGLFQAQERMDYIARSLCLLGPLSLALLTFGFWLTGSLVVAIAGQVAAHLLVLLFYDLRVGRRRALLESPQRRNSVPLSRTEYAGTQPGGEAECMLHERPASFWPQWHMPALRRLFVLALPLTFATVLVMFALYLPRLVIEEALGLEALGYFAAIMALAMAPARLIQAFGTAASVRLARHHANGERAAFMRLLLKMTLAAGAIGAIGLVLVALFGEQVLRVVYTQDYADYADVLLWVVVAATIRFMAETMQFGMLAARRFWWITFQHGCVALAAALACFNLIPTQGLPGAALALVIIFTVQFIVIMLGLLRNLPINVVAIA